MPELPELEVLRRELVSSVKGRRIQRLRILKPYVLRNIFGGDLRNEIIENITRRGKYLVIDTDLHTISVHLMLRGSLEYIASAEKIAKSAAAVLEFADGTRLQFKETGHKKRMAVYILPGGEYPDGIARSGIEPGAREFTVERLAGLLAGDSMQLKSFLCDQRKIAGIGNAYADEILWNAGLSPFKITATLNDEEVRQLHNSIVSVMMWAVEQVNRAGRPERRNFLNVHGKKGSRCARCGDIIQTVSYSDKDTFYCPTCQTQGKRMKNRRLSKFYR
ncbi:MAG: Fpg/Nei family DNA glycosylase [candidate division WOR-3 bacterium]|nr:MAG: Fpg/Nei family DNA glycosylase [candidate division WOR-3 bacterium]